MTAMASEGELKVAGRHSEKAAEQNCYEGKFNTLRIISLKAINEFETLQKKCEQNYAKYLEERENYMRTKKELDVLKEVSGEALGEYENLHRKFTIEQDCRDKAEEFAKQAVRENKQLKRQSAILINTLTSKVVDIDLEELANTADNSELSSTEDHGFCNKQIGNLKEQVESLKIKVDELSEKLSDTDHKLLTEQENHKKTKDDLINNNANLKQLNRVSLLALDDYTYLQQKYEMEMQNRVQAEKLVAEENPSTTEDHATDDEVFVVSRDHEAIVKQSEVISKESSNDKPLQKALGEINTLTKQLYDQKREFDEKVKELEEELSSSNDVQKLQNLESKIITFSQGMETLESRLGQAQTRANQAEAKVKSLEQQLKAQTNASIPAAPPLPPPPPPPPPPGMLLKKFVGIMSGGKRAKSKKKAEKEDPRITAMTEMMDRIKNNKIVLRKIETNREKHEKDGEAMKNLKVVLKTLKQSPSEDGAATGDSQDGGGDKPTNFGVQLRKTERKPRSASNVDELTTGGGQFPKLTLRKPRSRSVGDALDDDRNDITETEMDQDLLKLLRKRKASSEREMATSELKILERKSSETNAEAKMAPAFEENEEQHIKDVVGMKECETDGRKTEGNEQKNEVDIQPDIEQ